VILSQATLAQGDRVDVRLENGRFAAVCPGGTLSELTERR
jgi:hypothetical protein